MDSAVAGLVSDRRLGMRRERFAERRKIILIHDGGSRIHPSWHRRGRRGSPVLVVVNGVVMEIVQELQAIETHHIGFLYDRSGNRATLNPVQCFGIFVKRHDQNFAGKVQAMQRIRSALASGSLQPDNAVGLLLALNKSGNGVVSVAGVPFVINGLGNFDSRIFLEGFLDAANPFAKIEL